ncbi:bacteriocin immunity protein [Oenococcus sicerae]|uniref:Bacteriocin immunity protein n=1 Tax=Oenococcus sicerae TaxID=2203724 RepID=A0AAJ1REI0_9LACO|nr:bacteriocin immunity protein [Oenococcus sicerae]MDN6900431.1 bacteriocin immunity protein [Oenococcus sicerae]
MTFKKPDADWLHDSLSELLSNNIISDTEKSIFVSAKKALEKTKNDRSVVSLLKSQLTPLAINQKLTAVSVQFFNELSQRYIGPTGIGGRDVLFNI